MRLQKLSFFDRTRYCSKVDFDIGGKPNTLKNILGSCNWKRLFSSSYYTAYGKQPQNLSINFFFLFKANIGEKPKKKERPKQKRQTFAFDLSGQKNHPFAFSIDSQNFEQNFDYRDLNGRIGESYRPGHPIPTQLFQRDASQINNPTNAQSSTRNEIEEMNEDENPEKEDMIGTRYPHVDLPPRYDFGQQLYNGAPVRNYDQYVENEIDNENRGTSPQIGVPVNVNSIFNSQQKPIGPAMLDEPEHRPESLLEKSMQNIVSDNNLDIKSFANKLITPNLLARYRSKPSTFDFENNPPENSVVPFNFQSNELAAREAIPEPSLAQIMRNRFLRDSQIRSLIRKYNEQTRKIESLRSKMEPSQENEANDTPNGILPPMRNHETPYPLTETQEPENYIQSESNLYKQDRDFGLKPKSFLAERETLSDPDYHNLQAGENLEETGNMQQTPSRTHWSDSQAQRKDILERGIDYPSQNPDDFLHKNIIKEFIRYMALRNNILQRNEDFYPPSFTRPSPTQSPNQQFYSSENIPSQSAKVRTLLAYPSDYHHFLEEQNQSPLVPPTSENYLSNALNANDQLKDSVTHQQGIVMLMVTTPPVEGDYPMQERQELVQHKGMSCRDVFRTLPNI